MIAVAQKHFWSNLPNPGIGLIRILIFASRFLSETCAPFLHHVSVPEDISSYILGGWCIYPQISFAACHIQIVLWFSVSLFQQFNCVTKCQLQCLEPASRTTNTICFICFDEVLIVDELCEDQPLWSMRMHLCVWRNNEYRNVMLWSLCVKCRKAIQVRLGYNRLGYIRFEILTCDGNVTNYCYRESDKRITVYYLDIKIIFIRNQINDCIASHIRSINRTWDWFKRYMKRVKEKLCIITNLSDAGELQ